MNFLSRLKLWQKLSVLVVAMAIPSPDEAVARDNVLLAHIQKLGETVAAGSGMTVDPSPETAVLIQIAARNVPGALIASGNVRWYAGRATIKGYLGGDDRMAIQ